MHIEILQQKQSSACQKTDPLEKSFDQSRDQIKNGRKNTERRHSSILALGDWDTRLSLFRS